jgi:predicted helicase
VYLTNALTGWKMGEDKSEQYGMLTSLEDERAGSHRVKQSHKILVVIGNPPYNAFAGTASALEGSLVDVY